MLLAFEAERVAPAAEDLERLRELLAAAERPLVVVGEGGWTAETSRDVQAFCEANELPVACAFRCQDFVDNRSPSYVGVLGVAMDEAIAGRLRDADLVLAIGGRLGEVPDAPLHAPRAAEPEADARPRPSGPGRARSRVRARSRDRSDAARRAHPRCSRSTRWSRAGASGHGTRAPTTSEPSSTSRWRATSTSARSWPSCGSGFPATRFRRAARATSPSGRIASRSSRSSARRPVRAAGRWGTGFRLPSPHS